LISVCIDFSDAQLELGKWTQFRNLFPGFKQAYSND